MKKIVLSFIVLCVSVMTFGMVALAAPDANPDNANVPVGHQCEHGDCMHLMVSGINPDAEVGREVEAFIYSDYEDSDYEDGNPLSDTFGLDQFATNPESGKIYYFDGETFRLCSNSEPEEEEKSEDSHSSSSDDEPARPTEEQLKMDSIYSSVDSQIKSIVESVGNGDSQNSGRVTIDGEDLINSLPKRVMSKMAENPSIELFFNYTYNGMKYTTAIPAGASIDPNIEWFGPLYLMTHYPTLWHQTNETSVPVMAPIN